MPEIPDLLYINGYLRSHIVGTVITGVEVMQPVVLRVMSEQPPEELLCDRRITASGNHGPFLRFDLDNGTAVLMNLMLAGRLRHQRRGERAEGYRCISFHLDDGSVLHLSDQKKMAKVYIVTGGDTARIPRYDDQGIDIRSEAFTFGRFEEILSRHRRKQVRSFLTDQRVLSAIGNAYADEILFEARIHPKTFVGSLSEGERRLLFDAIGTVLDWGIGEVRKAGEPIHVKVRTHMKVRNRKGAPCPRCGTTIRREGVRGYDVFFCPACQPPTRTLFLDWRKQ